MLEEEGGKGQRQRQKEGREGVVIDSVTCADYSLRLPLLLPHPLRLPFHDYSNAPGSFALPCSILLVCRGLSR